MNKHELAKWVAENVLASTTHTYVECMFSPEGYFDVLRATQEKFHKATISFWKDTQYVCQIDPDEGMDCGDITSRSTNMYIAFYTAVKQLYGCYKKCNRKGCDYG